MRCFNLNHMVTLTCCISLSFDLILIIMVSKSKLANALYKQKKRKTLTKDPCFIVDQTFERSVGHPVVYVGRLS